MIASRLLLACCFGPLFAADGDAAPLFADVEPLAVTIVAPLDAFREERDSGEYHDGTLTVEGGRQFDIKLRARGRYRRQERTCEFPPVRLNFRKKQVEGSVFDGQDKLKLVTHCRTERDNYEQQLLKEYLAYRILASVTEQSFRTRLLRISWQSSDSDEGLFERYAFLIEDEDLLGERLGLEPAEVKSAPAARLAGEQAALVAVFEYLIANTDFSLIAGPADDICCHNIVLYRAGDELLPVPYDFDFAGLVGAPYAVPNPKLKIRSVRTRLYRGRCEHNEHLPAAVQAFRNARADIMRLVDTVPGLEDDQRGRSRRFIEQFYKTIDSDRRVSSRLLRRCL